jgi:[ribosomal protein S5]-alanine N-acetyltransferase
VSAERLETARLVGTRIGPGDLDRLRALYQDARVAETLGGLRTDEWVENQLAFELDHWRRHGFGAWMFVARDGGSFVGRGAVRHARVLDGDQIEVGYALVPAFWGRGLASEMAAAMVAFAREELALDEIAAWTLTTNVASQRVLEKAGLVHERDFEHVDLPHRYYRLVFRR